MIRSDVFNIKNYEETKVIELKPKLGRNDLCHYYECQVIKLFNAITAELLKIDQLIIKI